MFGVDVSGKVETGGPDCNPGREGDVVGGGRAAVAKALRVPGSTGLIGTNLRARCNTART